MALSGVGATPESEPQPSSPKKTVKGDSSNNCIFENEETLNQIDNGDKKLTVDEVIAFFSKKFGQNFHETGGMKLAMKMAHQVVGKMMTSIIVIGDRIKNLEALKFLEAIDTEIHKHISCRAINKDYNDENRRIG